MAVLGILSTMVGCLTQDRNTFNLLISDADEVFAENANSVIVRIFYVEAASESTFTADYLEPIDAIVNDAQQFFANEMEKHGHGRKTFRFRTDHVGKVIVNPIKLDKLAEHYTSGGWEVILEESYAKLTSHGITSENRINVFFTDINSFDYCGRGAITKKGGKALIFGNKNRTCWTWKKLAHELGHAMGLQHDFQDHSYLMGSMEDVMKLSFGASQWLNHHVAFNDGNSILVSQSQFWKGVKIDNNPITFNFYSRPAYGDTAPIYDYAALVKIRGELGYPEVLGFTNEIDYVYGDHEVKHIVRFSAEIQSKATEIELHLIGKNSEIITIRQ